MKRVLLATAFVVAFSSSAVAKEKKIGNWIVKTEIDAFKNTEFILGIAYSKQKKMSIAIRCKSNYTDVILEIIGFGIFTDWDFVAKSFDHKVVKIGTRIGNMSPEFTEWELTGNDDTATHQYPIRILNELKKSEPKQLVVRAKVNAKLRDFIFSTAGIEDVYRVVTKPCSIE